MKFQTVDIIALRATRLAANGTPLLTAGNQVVTGDLGQLAYTYEIEGGERQVKRNGRGDICFTRETADKVLGSNVVLDLCHTDPELMELLTGATLHTAADGPDTHSIGWSLPDYDAPEPAAVLLEAWSLAWAGDQQATEPIDNEAAVVHRVWPSVRFQLSGNPVLNSEALVQQVSGKGRSNAQAFDAAPGTGIAVAYGEFGGAYGEFVTSADNVPVVSDGYVVVGS